MSREPPARLRTISVDRCPVCEGSGPVAHDRIVDTTFGSPGSWRVRRCNDCSSLWLDPRPSDDDLPLAYLRYYTHGIGDASAAPGGDRAKVLLRYLPGHRDDRRGEIAFLDGVRAGRVLDVGCGDGRTLVALQDAGWHAVGLDPDLASVEAARTAGAVDARLGTIDSLDEAPGSFDAVISVHSLEHVTRPKALLQEAYVLLRPGGTISILTPNANSWLHRRHQATWRGLEPPRHLQVFSPEGLEQLVLKVGFENVRITTSARGANGIVRAHRMANRPNASPWAVISSYAEGEVWQLAEALRLRYDALVGEELVAVARRPA